MYFADYIFKYILFVEKFGILIKISLKFVPDCPISSKSASVYVMACCPLPKAMLTKIYEAL